MASFKDYISGFAIKRLTQVDLPYGSNQHELDGVTAIRKMLGTDATVKGALHWKRLYNDEDHIDYADGSFTFYDARARSAERTGRSEWRMYYDESLLQGAKVGDILLIVRLKRSEPNDLHALLFDAEGDWSQKIAYLFEVPEAERWASTSESELSNETLSFAAEMLLELLGIESHSIEPEAETVVAEKMPDGRFPSTKRMAELVHEYIRPSREISPDQLLVKWLRFEEEIFRVLEKNLVDIRLKEGFADVEAFISFSLSVHNRRKSRMGYSLENHIAKLLDTYEIRYSIKEITEGNNEPDFILPGIMEYRDLNFDSRFLTMLAAKSTLKDRWRQILVEAERIPVKHLCTLEPRISRKQTDQITAQRVVLVIPEEIRQTFYPDQRAMILSLQDFVSLAIERQSLAN